MDVYFTLLQGFGYVIPRNVFTDEEMKWLYSLEEERKYDQLGFVVHGRFSETDESQIFIFLEDEVDRMASIEVSSQHSYAYNCRDFSVRCYYGKNNYNVKYYDPKTVEREHNKFLENVRLTLDSFLEENVPWLFDKLTGEYRDCYEKWFFGILD